MEKQIYEEYLDFNDFSLRFLHLTAKIKKEGDKIVYRFGSRNDLRKVPS